MEELRNQKDIIEIDETIKKRINVKKQLLGVFIYICVFAITIPIILYKNKFYIVLQGYLPNLDLVANLLCWYSGDNGLWSDLYSSTALSLYGFFSQSFVNYLALLGVTFIFTRRGMQSKSMMEAWSPAFIMLLVTYLLPSNFIRYTLNKFHKIYNNREVTVLFGIIVTSCIVLFESFLIKNLKKTLDKIAKFITTFPDLF